MAASSSSTIAGRTRRSRPSRASTTIARSWDRQEGCRRRQLSAGSTWFPVSTTVRAGSPSTATPRRRCSSCPSSSPGLNAEKPPPRSPCPSPRRRPGRTWPPSASILSTPRSRRRTTTGSTATIAPSARPATTSLAPRSGAPIGARRWSARRVKQKLAGARSSGPEQAELGERGDAVVEADLFRDLAVNHLQDCRAGEAHLAAAGGGKAAYKKVVEGRTGVGSASPPLADDRVAFGDEVRGPPEVEVGKRRAEVGHERFDVVTAAARRVQ